MQHYLLLNNILGTIANTIFSILRNFCGYIVKMLGGSSNAGNGSSKGNNTGGKP